MGLGSQVVDLVGFDLGQLAGETATVREISVVQEEVGLLLPRVPIQMIDPRGSEAAAAPDQAMDLVALVEEKFGQV
jgi:hypothetical protein